MYVPGESSSIPGENVRSPARGVSAPPVGPEAGTERERLWARIQGRIRERLGLQRYGIWFTQAELTELDGTSMVVGVPKVIIKQYLEQEYTALVADVAGELLGEPVEVRFRVIPALLRQARGGQRPESGNAGETAARGPGPAPTQTAAVSPPTHWPRFDQLYVPPTNSLAFLVARQLAQRADAQFDFVLVLGEHGVGKTALLQATYGAALAGTAAGRVEYVTAEGWSNDYYHAVQTRKTRAFRRRYRACDMLLMDDVEFMQGKPAAQDELLHTAKSILADGGRVALSCTVHPDDLQDVKPAFCSLLSGTFRVELRIPAEPERADTARAIARRHGLQAADEVFQWLAQGHCSSIRELNGAVMSLAICASLKRCAGVDMAFAREALAATSRVRKRVPTLGDVVAAVVGAVPVSESGLKGRSRSRGVNRARQIGMYLARELTRESLSDIGRCFGGRTHSTVKHAVAQVEGRMAQDPETVRLVELCRAKLR